MQRKRLRILSALAIGFLMVIAGLSIACTRLALYPWWYKAKLVGKELSPCSDYQRRVNLYCKDPKADLGLDFSEFSYKSKNESAVKGWIVKPTNANNSSGTVILVHGGGNDRRALLKHVSYLTEAGFTTLLIDCWNHGLNLGDGKGLSFGYKESESVIAAAEYIVANNLPMPIYSMGTSQGGFSVLRAAALSPLFKAVVSENPYISVERVLLEFPAMTWVPGLSKKSAVKLVGLWWGINENVLDVTSFANNIQQPVFLIHGIEDKTISYKHSEEIYNLLNRKENKLWIVAGSDHEEIWNKNKAQYQDKVISFFKSIR